MNHPRPVDASRPSPAAPAVIFLAVLAGVLALLALAWSADADADVASYVVRDSTSSCSNPDVSGDLAVWEDQPSSRDVWARRMPDGLAFPVAQLASDQMTPAVDGTTVVWADDRASGAVYKIYGATVDPSSGAVSEFPVSTTAGVKTDPDVSGRYVVWVNNSSNQYDIYGYDLVTRTEFPICTNTAKQEQPAISGTLVVWRDGRHNAAQGDIYAARIGAGYSITEFAVRAQPSGANYVEAAPAVHGSTVAWVDQRGGGARTYAATVTDTTVSDEWLVATSARSCSAPAVNGSLITWTYTGGGTNDDIYGRRLDRSPEFAIASTSQFESQSAVTSSHTVWTNRSTWDIHGADVGGFGWTRSLLVDGGATYATDREVELTLLGISSVGTATQMSFSNDGVTWSGWEAYATSRAYQLPAGDGTATVYARYMDAEGNVSSAASDDILLDENAPLTTDDAPAGWALGDVTVTLTPDDGGGSGVATTVYDLDGLGVDTYLGPVTVSGEGVHTLGYGSVDVLGHAEDWKTAQVMIDVAPPLTTDNAGDAWHPSGFNLHLDAYDSNALDRTEYKIGGGAWQTGTDRVFVLSTKRGGTAREFVVEYRSVDVAGRVEETKTCTVRIDRRKPETTDDADGLAHSSDVVVTLTPADAESGVAETWYSLDGADPVLGTSVLVPAPADHSNDGLHTIVYYSVDEVGNVEAPRTATVLIATPAPAPRRGHSPR